MLLPFQKIELNPLIKKITARKVLGGSSDHTSGMKPNKRIW